MQVECRLREQRGGRSLKDLERETGINRGALSRYERGREFPPERQVPILVRAYGLPYAYWYPVAGAPAPRPHRERKKPSGARITFREDELVLLLAMVVAGKFDIKLDGDYALADSLTKKITRAVDRATT